MPDPYDFVVEKDRNSMALERPKLNSRVLVLPTQPHDPEDELDSASNSSALSEREICQSASEQLDDPLSEQSSQNFGRISMGQHIPTFSESLPLSVEKNFTTSPVSTNVCSPPTNSSKTLSASRILTTTTTTTTTNNNNNNKNNNNNNHMFPSSMPSSKPSGQWLSKGQTNLSPRGGKSTIHSPQTTTKSQDSVWGLASFPLLWHY